VDIAVCSGSFGRNVLIGSLLYVRDFQRFLVHDNEYPVCSLGNLILLLSYHGRREAEVPNPGVSSGHKLGDSVFRSWQGVMSFATYTPQIPLGHISGVEIL
jgi:hypothetical protein